MDFLSPLALTIATILVTACLVWNRRRAAFPPGPIPIPFIGNVFNLTAKELWVRATEWAEHYGDVVYLHVCGQSLLFLSSPQAALELMEKRGSIYSNKPSLVMVEDLVGGENMVAFAQYGARYKAQRKLTSMALGAHAIPTYHDLIQRESHRFLRQILLSQAKDQHKVIRMYAGALTLSVMYGYDVKSMEDEVLLMAEECLGMLANEVASGGGIWAVDVFPVLKYMPSWMPGSGFLVKAKKWKAMLEQAVDVPYKIALNAMASEGYTRSFCSTVLEDPTKTRDEQYIHALKWTANSMYFGSADTFISTITHLLLALSLHPEILQKARAEIDSVVGEDRLPDFSDRPRLPYVEAVLNELWRWSCPVPLGLPHSVSEDDVYRNKRIPKGSLVFANIWAMTRNRDLFSNPETFDPERYFTLTDPIQKRAMDPRKWIFGFGRRICPGIHLAEASIWSLTACILATLDIRALTTKNGGVQEFVYDNPIFREPTEFACDIRIRSEEAMKLILSAFDAE